MAFRDARLNTRIFFVQSCANLGGEGQSSAWQPGGWGFVTNLLWELEHTADLKLTLVTLLHRDRSGQ